MGKTIFVDGVCEIEQIVRSDSVFSVKMQHFNDSKRDVKAPRFSFLCAQISDISLDVDKKWAKSHAKKTFRASENAKLLTLVEVYIQLSAYG